MGIPEHLLASLKQTFGFEGGYVAHDKDNYPALFGFTASFVQEDARHRGLHITEAQAGEDITAMYQAHLKGNDSARSPHSKLSYGQLFAMRNEKAYDGYFKNHGFEAIAHKEVQKYVMEFSFNRGANSACWGMMYAAGVAPRNSDPLLHHGVEQNFASAVDYANGFLATGKNNHPDASHPAGDPHTNMLRFNARLRVAKMVQESQFAATHQNQDSVLGRFNRAFEFAWPAGSDINHPGLDPVKDKYFLAAYNEFKTIYQDYHAHRISHGQFNEQMVKFSANLLNDPTLPSAGTHYVLNTPAKPQPHAPEVHHAPTVIAAVAPHITPHAHPIEQAHAVPEVRYYTRASLERDTFPDKLTVQYYGNILSGSHVAIEAPGRGIIADISVDSRNEPVANGLKASNVTFTPKHEVNVNAAAGPNGLRVYDGTMAPASLSWKDPAGHMYTIPLTPESIAAIREHAGKDGDHWRIPNMQLETVAGNHLDPQKSQTIPLHPANVSLADGAAPPLATPHASRDAKTRS